MEENKFDMVDEFVISFKPNKRQFMFLKEVILKKEYQFKVRIEEGMKELVKAKEILAKASIDLYAFINFLMKSHVLKDKQILESKLTGTFQSPILLF